MKLLLLTSLLLLLTLLLLIGFSLLPLVVGVPRSLEELWSIKLLLLMTLLLSTGEPLLIDTPSLDELCSQTLLLVVGSPRSLDDELTPHPLLLLMTSLLLVS